MVYKSAGEKCVTAGLPLLPSKPSSIQGESGNYTVAVSTGLLNNISMHVSETLQCNITIFCLGCFSPLKVIEDCRPNVVFNDVPSGDYMVNVTVTSDCGETIAADVAISVGGECTF